MIFCRSRAVAFPPGEKLEMSQKRKLKPSIFSGITGRCLLPPILQSIWPKEDPAVSRVLEVVIVSEPGKSLTVAQADFIEFPERKRHHFFLKAPFRVRRGLLLTSERMKVEFERTKFVR